MERIEWKGDFLGFTFSGVHSSSLGIVRTSDGSRYNENLLPEFEDKTVKVPGRNETYYFGSEYKQRIFEVKIAFDNMTDKQFRQLRQLMSGQELKDLIFDEAPYKVYKVKANGAPSLSYIAFDEEYRRIYKGEGTLSFIAYFPFARSRFKYREDYTPKNIPEWGGIQDNKMSWLESSGIPSKGNYVVDAPYPSEELLCYYAETNASVSPVITFLATRVSDGVQYNIANGSGIYVPKRIAKTKGYYGNYKLYFLAIPNGTEAETNNLKIRTANSQQDFNEHAILFYIDLNEDTSKDSTKTVDNVSYYITRSLSGSHSITAPKFNNIPLTGKMQDSQTYRINMTKQLDEIKGTNINKQVLLLNNSGDINTNLNFCFYYDTSGTTSRIFNIYLQKVNKINNKYTSIVDWTNNNIYDGFMQVQVNKNGYYYIDSNSQLITFDNINERYNCNDVLISGSFFNLPALEENEKLILRIDNPQPITTADKYWNKVFFTDINYDYLYY